MKERFTELGWHSFTLHAGSASAMRLLIDQDRPQVGPTGGRVDLRRKPSSSDDTLAEVKQGQAGSLTYFVRKWS